MLTPKERERFADWLESDAESDELISEQAQSLPGIGSVLADVRRDDAEAKRRIAKQLRQIEDVT